MTYILSGTDNSKVSDHAKQISTYTSLKFSGASAAFNFKKSLYIALFALALLFAVFIAIPATSSAAIFQGCNSIDTLNFGRKPGGRFN